MEEQLKLPWIYIDYCLWTLDYIYPKCVHLDELLYRGQVEEGEMPGSETGHVLDLQHQEEKMVGKEPDCKETEQKSGVGGEVSAGEEEQV